MSTVNPVIRFRAIPVVHQRIARLSAVATTARGGAAVPPTDIARQALLIGLLALEQQASGPGAAPAVVRLVRDAAQETP